MSSGIIDRLQARGVSIPYPQAVCIGDEVNIDRIAPGVTLHPGCRLSGSKTLIMSDAVIGREGPVTIDDCCIGRGVELKGGAFSRSVFLDKVSLGLGAQVREGCLLEEEAGGAHTVGLKHTILLPFVTLGSLINLCDCLMSGGTSRKDHSEVGSSYIHFNYTPNQDKATPSLIGDVPRGVMLKERPIFLGGQGGLVGPATVGFGSVIAAGVVFQGDLPDGRLVTGGSQARTEKPFHPGLYGEIRERVRRNIHYIANLIALRQWYASVRALFLEDALLQGAFAVIDLAIDERIARLKALAKKMPESIRQLQAVMQDPPPLLIARQREFHDTWPRIEESLARARACAGQAAARDALLQEMPSGTYIPAIQGLPPEAVRQGTLWLQGIVAEVERAALSALPAFIACE